MKPDWKDAPEWANWMTMDSSGTWYWHENEPYCICGTFLSDGVLERVKNLDPHIEERQK